jgi:HAD superfamily hydrolase (TIGR01662 family)
MTTRSVKEMSGPGVLVRPAAVLLDHGGVIAQSTKQPDRLRTVAAQVHEFLGGLGSRELDVEQIEEDLVAAGQMYSAWKDGNVRRPHPRELTHREYWEQFVAPDWPEPERTAVGLHATPLCRLLQQCGVDKQVRPGMAEFLEECVSLGIRCGVVSNTLIGAVNRDLAERLGTAKFFAVQVHSDEVGMRKPNPEMIWLATRALRLQPGQCWFVGDQLNRDALCGRRAGVGAVVMMDTGLAPKKKSIGVRAEADASVRDPYELLELLRQSTSGGEQ